jgi:hypothetical protein
VDTLTEHVYTHLVGLSNTISTSTTHNVAGMPTTTKFVDGFANTKSAWTIQYTARGYPSQIDYLVTLGVSQTIGVQTRIVAGLVTSRTTALATTNHVARAVWSYDGRVATQQVRKGLNGTTQVARQDLTYFGNDDPSTLTRSARARRPSNSGTTRATRSSANATTSGYFTSSYQYGTAGRFTNVRIA